MAGHWDIVVPEAGTNLITNPSFETNTTGWALDGTNTIAQSTTQGRFGAYSLLCTYQDDTDLARYAITLTAAAHTFSVYVYLGSTWDGGAIQLAFEDFAGGSVTTATTTTTTLGAWVRLQATYTPVGGDLVGSLVVECASAPTAGRFIYVDAAMCTTGTYITTYIDGDQGGCSWGGAEHGSTSTRSATSRAGGRVRDLKDDYGFLISQVLDVGMSPLTQHVDEFAIIPGGEVSGYKVHPRVFVLQGTIYSQSSWTDLHSQIQGLQNVLRPDAVPNNQPVLLRYNAATVTKEIAVHYEGGLEGRFDARHTWRTDVAVRFLAADPTWYSEGEDAAALDTSDDLTIRSVAGRMKSDSLWSALGLTNNPDAGGSIRALLYASDGSLYIGGDFVDLDNTGTGIDRIAKYTPSTGVWSLVGSGSDIANGTVRCLAEAANGDIYVGGTFTAVAAQGDQDYVCYWDISGGVWANMDDPDSGGAGGWGGVYGLAFDSSGNLWVVGDFVNLGGVANADGIAYWTGAAWGSAGTPSAGAAVITAVNGVAIDASDNVYIGGDFTTWAGNAGNDYEAMWNGTAWDSISRGGSGIVRTVHYQSSDDNIYWGGEFINWIGVGASGDYIVKGKLNKSALSSGMNGIVWDIADDGAGNIYTVGAFTTAGGVTVDRIAIWGGSSFSATDIQPGATTQAVEIGAVNPGDDTDYDWYIGLGATATLTDGKAGSTTVTNNGNTEAFPRFVFKRTGGTSATLKQITNATTGKNLYFSYALQDGETLTVDMAEKTITSSTLGDQYGAVTAGSDFGTFSLLPGENTITCLVSIVGAPTMISNIIWRDSYWSIS